PQLLAGPALGLGTSGSIDGYSQSPGHLDGSGAYTTAASVYQQALAGPKPGPLPEVVPDSKAGLGQGCRLLQGEPAGYGQALPSRRQRKLRITATVDQGTDLIAQGPTGHIGPQRLYLSGDLQAQQFGSIFWRWIKSLPLQYI